jgi:hypothetical protein
MRTREAPAVGVEESRGPDEGVIEVGLLLNGRQLAALEAAAHERGLTAGGLLRRLIGEFLSDSDRFQGQG